MRSLECIESTVAKAVVELGSAQKCEFAGFLRTKYGPLIEIRTTLELQRAEPSLSVITEAGSGNLVCHHNHLSHESLSFADWRGLASIFKETFAHCADGTKYYGRIIDKDNVISVINDTGPRLCTDIEDMLTTSLIALNVPEASILAGFFFKEVVNHAMRICGYVDYEVDWGNNSSHHLVIGEKKYPHNAGHYGSQYISEIIKVAKNVAPLF